MAASNHPMLLTRRQLLRAVAKALLLFACFTVIYGIVDPVERGLLPTLYNTVLAGRERFLKNRGADAYQMIDDHTIASAQSSTYNIVILGSSEMWGYGVLADDTTPAMLNHLGLVSADGRPVRVYNLAHPVPYALRDLLLLDVVLQRELPIDLVLLSTMDTTLSYRFPYDPVVSSNVSLQMSVISHYNVSLAYQFVDGRQVGAPTPVHERLWRDRDAIVTWLITQMRGLIWTIMRYDLDVHQVELFYPPYLSSLYGYLPLDQHAPRQTDFLYAFQQLHNEQQIPIVILNAPVPYRTNAFASWLKQQTMTIGLPLLDCWRSFRTPEAFKDVKHFAPSSHASYAAIIARHLTDARLAAFGAGLPLRLPPDTARPESACVWHLPRTDSQ